MTYIFGKAPRPMDTMIPRNNQLIKSLLGVAVGLVCYGYAHADMFHYKDGRVISGQIVGRPQSIEVNGVPVQAWTVQIASGSYVQILESELIRNGHEPLSAAEQEYAQGVQASPPKTAQDHCDLAAWCTSKGLRDLSDAHYRRALDLDPNNKVARAAAGYKVDSNGRWVKAEVIMGEQRGKVFYKGRWRFPEDVAIEQARETADEEIAPLKKQLFAWHSAASFGRSEAKKREAISNLQLVEDPRAAGILADYLLDKIRTPPPNMRMLYVKILSRFPTAVPAITNASLTDPEPQVRNEALNALRAMGATNSVPTFVSYLQNSENFMVNRAADGIALFNPPEATLPLIYALNTEHEVEVGGGNTNYSTQGLAFGSKAKKEKRVFQNSSVLAALTQITKQNFDYDEDRWLAWYASVYASPVTDLRRDP